MCNNAGELKSVMPAINLSNSLYSNFFVLYISYYFIFFNKYKQLITNKLEKNVFIIYII